jgi:Flp pilus assembly protein TadG
MRLIKKRFGDRGAALVEAAIVIPILLLFTFGIWSTARAWSINNTLEHAAREAARYGATVDPWDPDPAGSPAVVRGIADDDLSASAIAPSTVDDVCIELVEDGSTSCDGTQANNTGTNQIYVRIELPDHKLNFLFFSIDVDLSGTAISRHES